MAEQETFALPLEGVAALQEHASARTFGILLFAAGVANPDDGLDGATGVGVRIGPRYFVATAGHNLCSVPDSGLVLVHEDQVSHDPTPFVQRWPTHGDSEPIPDVGYIELAPEVAERSPKRFVPLDQIRLRFARVGIHAVFAGFPVERVPRDLLRSHHLVNMRGMRFASRTV